MGYNPNKQVWFNPNIEYIFDTDIIEYDMKDAGFNIIKEYRLLPERTIKDLEMLGKGIDRHIAIGKMQGKDKEFSDRLSQKFAEMRAVFIDSNSLADSDIISVKKDAIFAIKECDVTTFGNIHFAEKNRYSSYIRFSNIGDIEIYYSDNGMDVKGLGESTTNMHRVYLIDFIKSVIQMLENKDSKVRRFVMQFIMDYKARRLDDEYYLKFTRNAKEFDLLFNFRNVIIPLLCIIQKELPG